MGFHRLVLYHHHPVMGTTTRDTHDYAYHTHEGHQDYEQVRLSRESLCNHLGFTSLVTLRQTHSDRVYHIHAGNVEEYLANALKEGDGLWTELSDVLIGVFTADCLPVFFWNEDVVGVVHAGRRGVYAQIHTKMVEELASHGYDPASLSVVIGPHIRSCCYEVGEDVLQGVSISYAVKRGGKWYLDLEKKVCDDLRSMGISHIETFGVCSLCSDPDLWYSYRRGEKQARHLHFVGKKI